MESNRRPQGYESCALPLSYIGTGESLINFAGFTSLIHEISSLLDLRDKSDSQWISIIVTFQVAQES